VSRSLSSGLRGLLQLSPLQQKVHWKLPDWLRSRFWHSGLVEVLTHHSWLQNALVVHPLTMMTSVPFSDACVKQYGLSLLHVAPLVIRSSRLEHDVIVARSPHWWHVLVGAAMVVVADVGTVVGYIVVVGAAVLGVVEAVGVVDAAAVVGAGVVGIAVVVFTVVYLEVKSMLS